MARTHFYWNWHPSQMARKPVSEVIHIYGAFETELGSLKCVTYRLIVNISELS
jgi:hypothetical protein